jgi:hypothetical protein
MASERSRVEFTQYLEEARPLNAGETPERGAGFH